MYAYILYKVETDIYIYAHIGTQARAYVHTYIFLYFPFTTFVQRIITNVEGVRRDWGKRYARRKRKGKVEKEKYMRKKNTATVSPTISIGDTDSVSVNATIPLLSPMATLRRFSVCF